MSFLSALILASIAVADPTAKGSAPSGVDREMSGVIIFSFSTDGNRSFILSSGNGGAFVRQMDDDRPERYLEGERVSIRDWTLTTLSTGTALCPKTILRQGTTQLPDYQPAIPERIPSGDYDYQLIRLEGIIIDAFKDEIDPRWTWFLLRSHNTTIPLTYHDREQDREDLRDLVDAEVSVCGCCMPIHKGHRTYMSSIVQFHNMSDIRILRPAGSADQFDVPELNPKADVSTLHRRRLSGTVLAVWGGNRLFLANEKGSSIQICLRRGIPPPPVQTAIDVVGFTETDNFFIKLIQASWRESETRRPIACEPADVDPAEIMRDASGASRIKTDFNGRLIRIRGHVRNVPPDPLLGKLNLDCSGQLIPVDIVSASNALRRMEPGALIEACGACLMEFANESPGTGFPRISGFSLIVRSDADIRILSNPPWWTPARLMTVIGILLLALVGILIWNTSLRIVSERRGRELFKSQIAKVAADLRVDERTRLAVELHDYLSQNLTAVSYQLSSGISCLETDGSRARKYLWTADRMLLSCRTELRRCLYDLRSEALEERDFAKAIRMTLQTVAEGVDIAIRFNVPRTRISDSTAHTVLSIIRELASNAVQHGHATQLRIAGDIHRGNLEFSVRDNGTGFDPSRSPGVREGHFGIEGIRDRIVRLNGTLALSSSSGSGTRAVVTIPVLQNHEHDVSS